MSGRSKRRRRGFTLVLTAIGLTATVGAGALAFDVGRMFVARGEVQTYVDALALSACRELDGTLPGIDRARAVKLEGAGWNFGSTPFPQARMVFAAIADGPWVEHPLTAEGLRFVRVYVDAPLSLTLGRLLVEKGMSNLGAVGTAGQVRAGPGDVQFSTAVSEPAAGGRYEMESLLPVETVQKLIQQDSDSQSPDYASYALLARGNGRRLALVKMDGDLMGLFLLPAEVSGKRFKAEYAGPFVEGSRFRGAAREPGYYVVRLVG